MDIEKAYSTHEIERFENLKLFLARNRHGLEAIHYSTFYYAETNICILILALFFGKTSDNPLTILTVHKLNCIRACYNGNTVIW